MAHDLACVLKLYIRTLGTPVIPPDFSDDFVSTLAMYNVKHSLQLLKALVLCLPTAHFNFLRAFCEHLAAVVTGDNQMNFGNLSLVLGGNFFRGRSADVISETGLFQNVALSIFQYWEYIFLNTPLVLGCSHVLTLNDIRTPKSVIGKGQRLKVVSVSDGGDEYVVDYAGSTVTISAADVKMLEDSDEKPGFWVSVPGSADAARGGFLEPTDILEEDAGALVAAIRRDLDELRPVEGDLESALTDRDEEMRDRELARIARSLAKF